MLSRSVATSANANAHSNSNSNSCPHPDSYPYPKIDPNDAGSDPDSKTVANAHKRRGQIGRHSRADGNCSEGAGAN